jgi:hypothetical protein
MYSRTLLPCKAFHIHSRTAGRYERQKKRPRVRPGGATSSPLLHRTRQDRLTGHGAAFRRRTGGRALTANPAREHSTRNRSPRPSKRNQWSTGRNNRYWGACRNWSTRGNRSASRHRSASGNRSAGGNRRSRCRTAHIGEWSTSRHARRRAAGRCRRAAGDCRGSDFARGALHARVAACLQRRGCHIRAQRYRCSEQPNASNDFDAESVEGCHRRQLPIHIRPFPAQQKMQPKARSHTGFAFRPRSFLVDRCSTCTTPHHTVAK